MDWLGDRWEALSERTKGAVIALAVVAAIFGAIKYADYRSHDAQRYCHDMLAGPLPEWVTKDNLFSTYDGCLDWYRAGQEAAAP